MNISASNEFSTPQSSTSAQMLKNYVGYTRVSTKKQAETGDSHDVQMAQLKVYADQTCGTLISESKDSASAFKGKAIRRPGLQSALAYAKLHGAVLLVASADRLTRSVVDLELLIESGVKLVATDMGEVTLAVLKTKIAKAQCESELKSVRVKAQHLAKKDGSIPKDNVALMNGRALGCKSNHNRRVKRIEEIADFLRVNPSALGLRIYELVQWLNASGPRNLKSIVDGHRVDWTDEALRPILKDARKSLEASNGSHNIVSSVSPGSLKEEVATFSDVVQTTSSEGSLKEQIKAVLGLDCTVDRMLHSMEKALWMRIQQEQNISKEKLTDEVRSMLATTFPSRLFSGGKYTNAEQISAMHDVFRKRL